MGSDFFGGIVVAYRVFAPYGAGGGETFLAGDVVEAFEVALVEDAAGKTHLLAYDVGGESLAGRGAAHTAVHLREVHLEFVDTLQFLVGFGEVLVESEHRAGLGRLGEGVFDKVVFVGVHIAGAGHLAVAFAFGGFAGAGVHAFTAEETVFDGEEGTGAALVAGAQFEEFHAFHLVVLKFVEEVGDVLDAVDGIGTLGAADAAFAVGEGGEDGVGGELRHLQGGVGVAFALFFYFAVYFVEEGVHIDDAVDDRAFLAHGGFDGGNLGGTGGDIEEAYLLARHTAFLGEHLEDIHGGDVEGGLDGDDVADKGGVFNLDKPYDGGAETGDEGFVVVMLVGVAVFDVGVDACRRLYFEDMLETEVLEGGIDAGDAYVVGKLAEEDGREEGHGVRELMHHFEVVLLDIDGIDGAGFVAFAAVYTAVFHDECLASTDADGFGGADFHATGAAYTVAFVDFKGVVKHEFRGVKKLNEIDNHFDGGADAHFGGDVEHIDVLLHVGEAHTGAETHVAHFGTGGGVAFLHGLRYVGDAGAFVGDDHVDFVGLDVDEDFAAVGMGYGVDFGFVEGDDNAFNHLGGDTQLLEGFLDGAGGGAGIGEIAFNNGVFLMHGKEKLKD